MAVNTEDKLVTLKSVKNLHDYAEDTYAKAIEIEDKMNAIAATGVAQLQVKALPLISATEGQTEFPINYELYDPVTDLVLVQTGRLWLNPNGDYTVSDGKVILAEGVPETRTIGIWIWKNVPSGDNGAISGNVIIADSLPVDRLNGVVPIVNGGTGADNAEQARQNLGINVTSDVDLHFSITETGTLRITYDDGSDG